jgi:hypothetical protein
MQLAAAKIDSLTGRGYLCLWGNTVQYRFPVSIRYDQARIAQDTQVMGQQALLNFQGFGQSAYVTRFLHETFHDGKTGSICQDLKLFSTG